MVDQHKALTNTLKNLRGIHGSGEKKGPAIEKKGATKVVQHVPSKPVKVILEEEGAPVAELQHRKRKKVFAVGSSRNLASNVEVGSSEDQLIGVGSSSYRSAIQSLPQSGRWA